MVLAIDVSKFLWITIIVELKLLVNHRFISQIFSAGFYVFCFG